MPPKMHTHAYPYTTLLSTLTLHLPTSGPLLRRIQYQSKTTKPSPTAQILASFPEDSNPDEAWIAAYVDVFRGPDTQCWVFSSLESRLGGVGDSNRNSNRINGHNPISEIERETAKAQLLSLFTYIQTTLIPPYIQWVSSQPVKSQAQLQEDQKGVPKIPDHPKSSFLVGTLHEGVVGLVCEVAAESQTAQSSASKSASDQSSPSNPKGTDGKGETGNLKIHRGQNVFYAKYCFPSSSFSSDQSTDPGQLEKEGYSFSDSNGVYGIQEHHLDLVKSRTNIPRSKEALMAMGGVALYHRPSHSHSNPHPPSERNGKSGGNGVREMPISWSFLGFDGSMCSLHVEAEHRGHGLGGLVGREVMKRGTDVFGRTPYSHSHHHRESERESDRQCHSLLQPHSVSVSGGDENRNGGGDLDGDGGETRTGTGSTGDQNQDNAYNHGNNHNHEEWFFADVAVQNTASRRVMEKMGGESSWSVAWIVVEVEGL